MNPNLFKKLDLLSIEERLKIASNCLRKAKTARGPSDYQMLIDLANAILWATEKSVTVQSIYETAASNRQPIPNFEPDIEE